MIFVERKLANGKTRLGLLGKLDLEEYSYEKAPAPPSGHRGHRPVPDSPPDEGPGECPH